MLNRTAFYPKGGGQPSDTGRIGDSKVEKVRKKGERVDHILEEKGPEKGKKVHCEIDWERRYAHMKYHTAQHVISAIVLDYYGGNTSGNQIYSNKARIDFDVDISEEVEKIEDKVNHIIDDEREVEIYLLPRAEAMEELDPERTRVELLPKSVEELRIVNIKGVDKNACAGTHVRNTAELGEFSITDTVNKGKNRKRVEFILE